MPLLQLKWPSVVSNLVQSVGHCQDAKVNLESLAEIDYLALGEQGNQLGLSRLQSHTRARLANILRVWIKNNQVRPPSVNILNRLIDDVVFASEDAVPVIQWGDVLVRRYQQTLYLLKNEVIPVIDSLEWATFPEPLKLGESGHHLYASPSEKGFVLAEGHRIQVRFREGGESFYWHGQNKQLKKLLQQWKVPPWKRDRIPLLFIDNELAAVVGFAVSDYYYGIESGVSYSIELL